MTCDGNRLRCYMLLKPPRQPPPPHTLAVLLVALAKRLHSAVIVRPLSKLLLSWCSLANTSSAQALRNVTAHQPFS